MGLFGSIGNAFKKVASTVGKVASTVAPIAAFVPGVGTAVAAGAAVVGKVAGKFTSGSGATAPMPYPMQVSPVTGGLTYQGGPFSGKRPTWGENQFGTNTKKGQDFMKFAIGAGLGFLLMKGGD